MSLAVRVSGDKQPLSSIASHSVPKENTIAKNRAEKQGGQAACGCRAADLGA